MQLSLNSNNNSSIRARPSSNNKTFPDSIENDFNNYKQEINHLNQLVKKYEEHNLKIPELEKKLKTQKLRHEKEIKDIESLYKEKIKKLEEKLKNNNIASTVGNTITNANIINNTGNPRILEYDSYLKNKNKFNNSNNPNDPSNASISNNKAITSAINHNYVKTASTLRSNTKTIDDCENDRVNVILIIV